MFHSRGIGEQPVVRVKGRRRPRFKTHFYFLHPVVIWYYMLTFLTHRPVVALRWAGIIFLLWRYGFLRYIYLDKNLDTEPNVLFFVIESPFIDHLSDGTAPSLAKYSRGFSPDYDEAIAKVVGECLERTPGLYFRYSDLLYGTFADLTGRYPVVDPELFHVFSAAHRKVLYANSRNKRKNQFYWERAEDLVTNEDKYLPARLIYWRYRNKHEIFLREAGTHGQAGYYTLAGATLRALYECIGRDGFFRAWYQGYAPTRLDLSTLRCVKSIKLVQELKAKGFAIHIVAVTSFIVSVPSFFCVFERYDGVVAAYAGGHGTDHDPDEAIYSAIEEATSMYHWLAQSPSDTVVYGSSEYSGYDRCGDIERLNFWAEGKNKSRLHFFLTGNIVSVADYEKRLTLLKRTESEVLEVVLRQCAEAGLSVFRHQYQHPLLKKLGFHSVKIIVPELIPMFHDMRHRPDNQLPEHRPGSYTQVPHIYP